MNAFYNSYIIGSLALFSFFIGNKNGNHSILSTPSINAGELLVACSAGTNEVKFIQCYDETDATLDTDRNDYFVCCAPPTWMPSECYELDANPIENDYPCVAGANIDGMKLTIVINSVSFDWSSYPCCEQYLEGLYANLYDNCTAVTCTVLGDGLNSGTPGMGDCSANGENLVFDPGTGNFVLPLPYTSVTDCLGSFFNTNESLGIDIVPSFKYDLANANGCNCPLDAITQNVVTVDYDIEIEYTFCESDLPPNCAQISFSNIDDLCENDPPLTLPTTSDEGISGTWNPSSINPSGQGGNTLQATFTPNLECEPTVTLNIPVDPFITPTFNSLANVCESDPLVPLQTTSNEGVVGTWDVGSLFDPSQYPGQTVTLNFTPDAGECADMQTLNITVLEDDTPTFSPIAPLCESDPIYFLPTTSIEGYTGNWQNGTNTFDPFGLGGQTVTLTFFTDPNQCADSQVTIDIVVNAESLPTFTQIGTLCETDPAVPLPTSSLEGVTGTWNPSEIDPNGEGGGSVTATFTPDNGQCAANTSMTVDVTAGAFPNFDPIGPLCESEDPITLPTSSNEGIQGSWSPATIDPSGQGGGTINSTFTPGAAECAQQYFISVTINVADEPTFTQVDPLCESDDPVTLPTFSDEGIEGTWNPSEIDPTGQGGNTITATFTPIADECANSVMMDVDITPETNPTFDPIDPLCESDDPINLETLSNNSITGTWDVGTSFDPSGQGGQTVTINFTPDNGQCASNTTLDIEVTNETTPAFDLVGPLCEDDAIVSLPNTSNDGVTGSWDIGTTFDPAGLGGTTTTIIFSPDADQCANNYTENVDVNALPTFQEMEKECNAGLSDYFVTIETNADDVNSSSGTVMNNMDGTFTIDLIPSGDDISLIITNTNTGCDESFTIVAPTCNCPPIDPPMGTDVTICENEPIPALIATTNGSLEIDWYDSATGGILLLENSTTYTPSQADTFYVESVDGMSDCTSNDRTAISLTIIPVDTFFNNAMTCDLNQVGFDTLIFSTNQCDSVVITETILSPSSEELLMATTCDPNLEGLDTLFLNNQFGCDSLIITETTLQNAIETFIPLTTCDPMMVGADTTIFQTANCDSIVIVETTLLPSDEIMTMDFTCNPSEEGFDTLIMSNQFGCDSVVIIEVILNPSQEFSFTQNTCNPSEAGIDTSFFQNQFGCDSIIITETNLSPSQEISMMDFSCNINDIGIDTLFLTNQFSCDSLIIIETIFSPADTTFDNAQTCDIDQVGLDTIVYNLANCDSIVIINTSLLPVDETNINQLTCDINEVGINVVVLANQFGCDSTILTITDLAPETITSLNDVSCNPNDVGLDTLILTNQFGCDSLIITETIFSPIDITFDMEMTCDINLVGVDTLIFNSGDCDSVVIFTTSLLLPSESFFNDQTCDPTEVGIDTVTLVNFNGCDSLVITETTFLPIDPTFENAITCDANQVGLDTMIFNISGCDSLVITNTTLVNDSETLLMEASCDPAQVGIDTVILVNFNGCDSLVITTTSLNNSDETNLMSNTCEPAEAGFDTLFLFNQNGCDSLVITETILTPAVESIEYQIEAPTCNFILGSVDIQLVNGGTPPYLYSIDGGNTFVANTLFEDLPEGDYEVVIQDLEGCLYFETVNIPAVVEPFISLDSELTIELGEAQILNPITNIPSNNIASILWAPDTGLSCSDCLTPTASPTESTTYLLTIVDNAGCLVTTEITIFVDFKQRFYIPNIFSPNADGVNDNFTIFGNEKQILEISNFQVFSRWGDLLFEAKNIAPNDLSKGWDGTTRGEKLDVGVYMYKATVVFANGNTREVFGDVTLVR